MQEPPKLASAEDCQHLADQLKKEQNVIVLWATALPRSSIKIMTYFYQKLQDRGWRCLLFIRENASQEISSYMLSDVYIFDDSNLLKFCNFISILFTHDYCITQEIPFEFTGKVYLFPHNSQVIPLRHYIDAQADGIIATTLNYNRAFQMPALPNALKRYAHRDLLIIPAGYPKFDILFEMRKDYTFKNKFLVYYPQILVSRNAAHPFGGMELVRFLTLFFAAYPDWYFVIRPYKTDRENPFLKNLVQLFSKNNFIIDLGDDNDLYLARATFFMTDTSSAHKLFSYTTLHPSLFFLPDSSSAVTDKDRPNDIFTEVKLGYQTSSAEGLLTALQQAELHSDMWKNKLTAYRDHELFHAGHTLDYLCDHMPSLLNGTKEDTWIALPKGNTPSKTLRDWLLFFARFSSKAIFFHNMPPFLKHANHICSNDPRLSLAALKMFIRLWQPYTNKQSNTGDFYSAIIIHRLIEALDTTPPLWAIKLLRRFKEASYPCVSPCLAILLHKYPHQEKQDELLSILTSINVSLLGEQFMSIMAYLMLMHDMIAQARALFNKLLPQAHLALPMARPGIGMYLLHQHKIESLQTLLQQWEREPVFKSKIGFPLLYKLIALTEKNQTVPSFFYPSQKQSVTLKMYGVPIFFESIVSARRILEPLFPQFLAEARADVTLWPQTLAAARLCRRGDVVALCAWEMFKVRRLSPKLLHELESEGFGPQLIELRRVLDRFARTHNSHGPVQ